MIDHAETPRVSSWYSLPGPDREIVLVSQVSLNRNIAGFPFQHLLDAQGEQRLRKTIDGAFYALDDDYSLVDGTGVSDRVRTFYEERSILVPGDHPGVSVISPAHDLIVRLGTADHLRISGFSGGFDLPAAREKAIALDRVLEEHLDYAVSLKLGYLSPDIKRVGTGLAATALLHLPALEHSEGLKLPGEGGTDRIVLNRYGGAPMAGAALYSAICIGEFSEAENEPITILAGFTERLLHYEQEARGELGRRHGDEIADTAGRALGTLRHARRLTAEETMDLLSVLRLGVGLGYVDEVGLAELTDAMFVSRDSQVRVLQSEDDTVPIDVARANLIRRLLGRQSDV